ncbi:MAG: hypothetical protein PCFJNLEI_01512 [Verrucomicrobiae bacterium]|nr:hypothetical protein [Verrucomicrobiae bacterium]
MAETVTVDEVVVEKTYRGKVKFPVRVPEGIAGYLNMPDDLVSAAHELGLSSHDLKFLLGATRGRCAMTVDLDLPDLAPKLGMSFAEIDKIVCGLVEKNYAEMTNRLVLYKLWVVLLHHNGIVFDVD